MAQSITNTTYILGSKWVVIRVGWSGLGYPLDTMGPVVCQISSHMVPSTLQGKAGGLVAVMHGQLGVASNSCNLIKAH